MEFNIYQVCGALNKYNWWEEQDSNLQPRVPQTKIKIAVNTFVKIKLIRALSN